MRGRFDRRDLCEEVDMDNTVLNHFLGHTFVCVYSHVDDRSFEGGQVLREELLLQLDEISSWSLVVGFDWVLDRERTASLLEFSLLN